MNLDIETYEKIDRYLSGELSEEELFQINKQLNSDPEFKSLVNTQQLANEVIVYSQMSKLKERMRKDLSQNKNGTSHWGKIIGISVLILSASLLALYYYHKPHSLSENKKDIIIVDSSNSKDEIKEKTEIIRSVKGDKDGKSPKNKLTADVLDTIPNNTSVDHPEVLTHKIEESNSSFKNKEAMGNEPELIIVKNEKVNCEVVHIHAEVRVDYGFTNEGEASIIIDPKSVKGGMPPYSYSLNGNDFEKENKISGIKDGSYHVWIKDQNNCISKLPKELMVKIPHKEIDEVFVPSQGEHWKFPVKENANAEITIINKAGSIVYFAHINNGNPAEWDGRSNIGVELETGNYYFVIKYAATDIVKGHISIVR